MITTAGTTGEQARQVIQLTQIQGSNDEILSQLGELLRGSPTGEQGVDSLRQVLSGVQHAGVAAPRCVLDVSIARGLDYYTGTIIETFLDRLPQIGSVCSGGRYDDLASVYTKERLPGIGASLGLDRLLAAMEELEMIARVSTTAPVFVPYFDRDRLGDYLRLAAILREPASGSRCIRIRASWASNSNMLIDVGFAWP